MYTGIIQTTQKAKKFEHVPKALRAWFAIPNNWDLAEGESINLDGACATVENIKGTDFSVYWMDETLKKTTFSNIQDDHVFNIERCLTLNDLIGGHLIQGHVDTTANVSSIEEVEDSRVITFSLPKEFTKYLIYKGSVGINGVSLTVVTVSSDTFSVSLIPYTLQHTNLGSLKVGDSVNIEIDMIAKYLEKLANTK